MLGVSAGSSTGGGAGGNLLQSLRAAGVGAAPAAAGGTTSPTPASATRPPAVASAGGNANAARPAGRSAAGPGAAGTGGKPSNAGKIQLADLRSILGSVQRKWGMWFVFMTRSGFSGFLWVFFACGPNLRDRCEKQLPSIYYSKVRISHWHKRHLH